MPPRGPRGPAAVPKSYGKSYRRPKRARPPAKAKKKPTLDQALRGVLDKAEKPKLVDRDVKVRKPKYDGQGKKVGTVTKTVRMPNQGAANRKRQRIYERDQVEKGVRAENMLLTDKGVDRRTRHEVPLVRAQRGVKDAMRGLGNVERVKFKAPKPKKTVGGLLENAGRNLKDVVVGAVPSAIELGKAGVEEGRNALQSVGTAGRVKGTRDGVKPIREGIKREDPLYALAEAGVKAVKGDGEGARRALNRAADKAYERPLDAAGYAAAGGGAASRGATVAKYAGKGGTAAATARPALKVSNGTRSSSDRQKVNQQRDAAQAEVRERQRATGGQKKTVRVDRDQDVQALERAPQRDNTGTQREQRYAKGAVGRTVQKKVENRKAAKGKDPFEATGRRARRIQGRRFDEQARNVHAGGLAREGQAEKEGREHAKRVKDPKGRVMVQLLTNQRVRPASAKADVAALRKQAAKGALPSDAENVRILDELADDAERLAADPKLRAEADQRAAALRESEGRAKSEGFFQRGSGDEAAPEFVAAMQPHLARGEIERVGGGDGPERHAQPGRSGPDTPKASPAAVSGKDGGSSPPPPASDGVQVQRRAAVKSIRRKLKKVDAEIAAIVMRERQAPTYTRKAGESDVEAAARAIAQGGQSAGRSGKVSGQAAAGPDGKTRVEIQGEKAGRERTRTARKVPVDSDRARLVALRSQRAELQAKHDKIIVAGQHEARKASARKVAAGPGGTRAVRGDGPRDAVGPAGAVERDHADQQRQQHQADSDLDAGAARVADVVGDGDTAAPVLGTGSHVVEVAHGEAASTTKGQPRKGTSVRSPGGYRWTSGPRKGQMVRPEDFDDQANQTFIRGLERDGTPSDVLRRPHAGQGYSAQDAISGRLDEDRILETQLDRERQITLIRLARGIEESFAHKAQGRTRFAPTEAQRIASQLSGPREKWTSMPVEDGKQHIVVRKVIADRWAQQIGRPGRTERALRFATRQFVRTVLPWSTSWHMGNSADLFTRLVVEDPALISAVARGRSQELFAHLDEAMQKLDPHLRRELIDTLQGHFGARATIPRKPFTDITDDAKLPLIRAAGEAISATRQLPGIRQVGDTVAGATDAAFDFGVAAESRLVHTAAGTALENYARALGIETADHARLAQQMADEFKADPAKVMEFHRRTLEITGDYITRSPMMRKLGNMGVPFINWLKAANRFVFLTLPRQHPYKVAMAMWAATITAEERAQLGLNYYLTDDEIERRGLPERQTMANAGGIVLNNGQVIGTAPFTSLGEAAKWLELGDEAASGNTGSAAAGVGEGAAALVARPVKAAINQNTEVAASRVAEGFIPGAGQVRKAGEGDRPHPYSTVWDPTGTGDRELTDRVLAALGAPQPRTPYRESKTKKERAADAVGTTRSFIISGPGGTKRVKRVVKTKP